jgi:hypothetical protein
MEAPAMEPGQMAVITKRCSHIENGMSTQFFASFSLDKQAYAIIICAQKSGGVP